MNPDLLAEVLGWGLPARRAFEAYLGVRMLGVLLVRIWYVLMTLVHVLICLRKFWGGVCRLGVLSRRIWGYVC
jgi:hypothetical protein